MTTPAWARKHPRGFYVACPVCLVQFTAGAVRQHLLTSHPALEIRDRSEIMAGIRLQVERWYAEHGSRP